MKIRLENIGQIEQADILLEGITVIAGENNTGKSTIGRSLFALLREMDTWKEQYSEKCSALVKEQLEAASSKLEDFCLKNTAARRRRTNRAAALMNYFCEKESFIADIEDYQVEENEHVASDRIAQALYDYCCEYTLLYVKNNGVELVWENRTFFDQWINEMLARLKAIQMDELVLQAKRIRDAFSHYFKNQFIREGQDECSIVFENDGQKSIVKMSHFENQLSAPVRVNQSVFFIESPRIFDEIGWGIFVPVQEQLKMLMAPNAFSNILWSVPVNSQNRVRQQERNGNISKDAENVLAMLRKEMGGQAEYYSKEGIRFKDNQIKTPIYPQNVSTGVKAMAFLEYAVRIGVIQKKDILILDEPEINLHPQWQIVYAKALVLLQKAYGLTLLITTHSPYFLRAIECFSDLNGSMDSLNVYSVSRDGGGRHVIENVMFSEYGMTELYERLSVPFEQLQAEIDRYYGDT